MAHTTSLGVLVIDLRGEAGPVHARAAEIERLSVFMSDSAVRIRQIASGEAKGLGYSMDTIRTHGDDLAGQLDQAADRYSQGGQAYSAYAVSALDGLKPAVDTQVLTVEAAHGKWEAAKAAADAASGTPAYPGLKSIEVACWTDFLFQRDVIYQNLFTAWRNVSQRDSAKLFQASDIMQDSFWMNLLGAVDWTVKAASGVALATGLAAIAFPPLGAVAVVASGIALAGTAVLAANGKATGGDIAWASISVIPIAKLGKVASAALQSGRQSMANVVPLARLGALTGNAHHVPGIVAGHTARAAVTGSAAGSRQLINETIWQVTKPYGQVSAVMNARHGAGVYNGMIDAGQNANSVGTLRNALANVSFTGADARVGALGTRANALAQSGHPAAASVIDAMNTAGRRSVIGAGKGIDDLFKDAFKSATTGMDAGTAQGFRNAFFGQLAESGGVPSTVTKTMQGWLEQPWSTTAMANGHEYLVNAAKVTERLGKAFVNLEMMGIDVTPGFSPSDLTIRDAVTSLRNWISR